MSITFARYVFWILLIMNIYIRDAYMKFSVSNNTSNDAIYNIMYAWKVIHEIIFVVILLDRLNSLVVFIYVCTYVCMYVYMCTYTFYNRGRLDTMAVNNIFTDIVYWAPWLPFPIVWITLVVESISAPASRSCSTMTAWPCSAA